MSARRVVSHDDWIAARRELLEQEKKFTRLRDQMSRRIRELPRERVEKEYVYDSPAGRCRAQVSGVAGFRPPLLAAPQRKGVSSPERTAA